MPKKLILAAVAAAALSMSAAPALARPAASAAPPASAVKIDRARIDAALKAMVDSGRAVGVSALVWQDGKETYFGATGMADREAGKPMARDTLVQIFSMTKPVTGVALMQLWEQGKFGLDDPLAAYLPEYADAKVADGAGGLRAPARPISVRDILRHTAGFSYGMRETTSDAAFRASQPLDLQNDLAEFSRRNAQAPLMFDPGQRWSYSASVDVQARLVEVLSGQVFEAFVRANILDPLKMKDTAWTADPAGLPRFAASYVKGADGKLARIPDERAQAMNYRPRKLTMGGAGLVSSVDDYMRFARMLVNGGELDGARILKPSTVRLMATDQLDAKAADRWWLPSKGSVGFGFNFAVRVAQPKTPEENRGAVGEFFWDGAQSTLFWVDPVNKLTAVFFVQTQPFDGTLHHDIRKAVYGADYLGPKGD